MRFKAPLLFSVMLAVFFAATGALEFVKLPHLMSHFQEHQQENPGDSFMDFLAEHYAQNSHHQDDHKDKGCLPFQGDHQHTVAAFMHFYCENTVSEITPAHHGADKKIHIPYQENFNSCFSSNIWQPPKHTYVM